MDAATQRKCIAKGHQFKSDSSVVMKVDWTIYIYQVQLNNYDNLYAIYHYLSYEEGTCTGSFLFNE